MAVSSMTGFARAEGEYGDWSWSWETKSVNSKALDVRVRMPGGHDRLELPVRQAAQKCFKRGALNLVLTLSRAARPEAEARYKVNRGLLDTLLETARAENGGAAVNIESLLQVRGVVEKLDEPESESDQAERQAAILNSLGDALDALRGNRDAEGAKLAEILGEQLRSIAECAEAAASVESLRTETKRDRLHAQIRELLDAAPPVAEERLAQELAMLAVKSDITEELDRLGAHLSAARELLDEGGAIGRRLDFLCQELNREANTICSKSGDTELTKHGLEMKAFIEQFREQVQNVE